MGFFPPIHPIRLVISPTQQGLTRIKERECTNPDGKQERRFDVTICFCNRRCLRERIYWMFVSSRKEKQERLPKLLGGEVRSEPQIHSQRTSDRHAKPRRLLARFYQAYATTLRSAHKQHRGDVWEAKTSSPHPGIVPLLVRICWDGWAEFR